MYTLLRLGLFVASLAVLIVLGAGELLALVLAAVISMALSYVLLSRQREAVADRLARRVAERRLRAASGAEQDADYEDRLDDENRRTPPPA